MTQRTIENSRLVDGVKINNLPTNTTTDLAAKQATLVSGTNIKTINSESLLGSGNIEIAGGGGGAVDSVNTQTGDVVLDADDIDDSATTNKYTTAGDISKLAGIEAGAEVNTLNDVIAGTNVTIDKTNPLNPVISSAGGGNITNYLNSYKAPQLFNPSAGQVTAGTADFTLSGASDVGIVTINGQTLDDSEYSLTSVTLTVTPDNGFFDINDEVLVFQTVLAVSEIPTGWASYVDTVHIDLGTAQTILANTDTILDNNAGNIIDSQKPTHVTTFYDGATRKITGRNGDNLDIMIYFKAVPSVVNQHLDIWIDIGGTVGELYRQTFNFPKGTGVERGILYALPSSYTLGTWEANGATVYIRSNANFEIYKINYNFDLSHKAR